MMTVKNVICSAKAEKYFREDSTVNTAHYYSEDGRIKGAQWWGRGADDLALRGEVSQQDFAKLIAGQLPDGTVFSSRRRAGTKSPVHRKGFDLTFSAPKSVSIAGLVFGDAGALAAHDAAVSASMTYIQDHAIQARRTVNGKTHAEQTKNLIVACFPHDTSRENDPQRHTHAVVINATKRSDGQWRSIWNTDLYRAQEMAKLVYRSVLARELQKAGYEIETRDGEVEIAGISKEHIKVFSKRRTQILGRLEETGEQGAAAAQKAAYDTRKAKNAPDRATLLRQWHKQAREVGLTPEVVKHRAPVEHSPVADAMEAGSIVRWVVDHLSERRSVLDRNELAKSALERGMGKVVFEDIDKALDELVRNEELIPVLRPRHAPNRGLEGITGQQYTTPELTRAEAQMLALMRRGRDKVVPLLDDSQSVQQAAASNGLTHEQAAAAVLVLTAKDHVVGIQGYAGVGKTRSLRLIREEAEAQGWSVLGMAPSGAAAHVLARDAGVASKTLARHLIDTANQSKKPKTARELWIVDEAGMVSSKQMRDLFRAAQAARNKGRDIRVSLVGDSKQLASIEAGAPFRLLADRGMQVAKITEIKRQDPKALERKLGEQGVKETEKKTRVAAAEQLRGAVIDVFKNSQPEAGLARLTASRQIVVIPDDDKRVDAIVSEYLSRDKAMRAQTLLLATTNAERHAINEGIRSGLQDRDELAKNAIRAPMLVPESFTLAQQRDVYSYEPGHIVRFARAQKALGIAGGEYLRVDAVDRTRGEVWLVRESGTSESKGGNSDESKGKAVAWKPDRNIRVEVYTAEGRDLAVGDVLRWTRADTRKARLNGLRVEVEQIDTAKQQAIVRRDDGGRQTIDLKKADHWEHAYAVTVHASQGDTSEYVMASMPTRSKKVLGRESFGVAISRARYGALVYTDNASALPPEIAKSTAQDNALDWLPRRGGRSLAQGAGTSVSERAGSAVAPPSSAPKVDFQALTREVNLVDYAIANGYEINKKKTSRRDVVLAKGEDKIVVSRDGEGRWRFFSPEGHGDNGSIIRFMMTREGLSSVQAAEKLQDWSKDPAHAKGIASVEIAPPKYNRAQIQASLAKMEPVNELLYLDIRGVTREVLASERFKGRVYSDSHGNAVFPYYDSKGVCGFERKNLDFSGFSAGGEKVAWHSNKRDSDVKLVVTEAVIDALSYHKLHRDESTRYLATGGTIGDKSATALRAAIDEMPKGASIVLAFDRDEAGERYAAKVASMVPAGKTSERVLPGHGKDWNDELMFRESGTTWTERKEHRVVQPSRVMPRDTLGW